jgi:hypothetical protein
MRISLQSISGEQLPSIETTGMSTLQDLKASISKELGLGAGLTLCLLLGTQILREEVNAGSCWKLLSDYGIYHGAVLSVIKCERQRTGMINIAVQEWPAGELVAITIDISSTLDELEELVCQRYGLPRRSIYFQLDGEALRRELHRPLFEFNVEGGKTLIWSHGMEREALAEVVGKENVPPSICNASRSSVSTPELTGSERLLRETPSGASRTAWHHSESQPQSLGSGWESSQESIPAPCTPISVRRIRDRAASPCKEKRAREMRAKKMLKRL